MFYDIYPTSISFISLEISDKTFLRLKLGFHFDFITLDLGDCYEKVDFTDGLIKCPDLLVPPCMKFCKTL